ncbi:MAG: flap endonuclease-1 [Theionarchaea archaeon]|nr:flap endonuclease-1 [Theionarchaea archaeon]MBU7036906.1 flap endonuclease-1 [Theionarchaea archaeon]
MGVNLTPIIKKRVVDLAQLSGKTLAFDANNVLYQFLALIRTGGGVPLTDDRGNITSHLHGLAFRATRLLCDYHINLVYVFDGTPPALKKGELQKRKEIKERAQEEWKEALRIKDYATAYSKSTMTSRLTKDMIEDAQRLLTYMGIPWVQAPSEAEAQAAFMTRDIFGAASRDYDTLLFGAKRQVRYVTVQGKEYLPSKGLSRRYKPEIITLKDFLDHLNITREQLVDMSILMGNDFTPGIKGIGPKTALNLMRTYDTLEALPPEMQEKLPQTLHEIRQIFLNPDVTATYSLAYSPLQEDDLLDFLRQRRFSEKTINTLITRLRGFHSNSLERWL